jgi:hypothetical protein
LSPAKVNTKYSNLDCTCQAYHQTNQYPTNIITLAHKHIATLPFPVNPLLQLKFHHPSHIMLTPNHPLTSSPSRLDTSLGVAVLQLLVAVNAVHAEAPLPFATQDLTCRSSQVLHSSIVEPRPVGIRTFGDEEEGSAFTQDMIMNAVASLDELSISPGRRL